MTAEYLHHVSFRLKDGEASYASDLRATFPENTWGELFRHMLNDPRHRALLNERLTGRVPADA